MTKKAKPFATEAELAAGSEWLKVENGVYLAGAQMPDFKHQHPRVYAEIAAEAETWMPPAPLLIAPPQKSLFDGASAEGAAS
jgi:uncharacterized Zn-finger protein